MAEKNLTYSILGQDLFLFWSSQFITEKNKKTWNKKINWQNWRETNILKISKKQNAKKSLFSVDIFGLTLFEYLFQCYKNLKKIT